MARTFPYKDFLQPALQRRPFAALQHSQHSTSFDVEPARSASASTTPASITTPDLSDRTQQH
jgi:hypothetical protein